MNIVAMMTVSEVSAYLGVHPSSIYRLLKLNQIPAFRVRAVWRFEIEAIDRPFHSLGSLRRPRPA